MDNQEKSSQPGSEPEGALPALRRDTRSLVSHPHGGDHYLTPSNTHVEAAAPQEDEIDLIQYWRILVKRKWMILSIVAFALGWSAISTFLETRIYRATATVQIESQAVQVVNMGETSAPAWGERGQFETQLELLKSRSLAQRVASDLALFSSGDVERMRPPSSMEKIGALFGRVPSAGNDEATAEIDPVVQERSVVGMLQGSVSVEPVRDSALVRVNFDSPSPEFSRKVVNGYVESFVAANLERRFESSSYAKTFLEERLKELRVKLEESERELVAFAQKEQIVGSSGGTSNLSEQNLDSLNSALAAARSERVRAETRWRQAQASTGTIVAGMIGEKSMIQTLQQSLGALKSDYQNKLTLYKPSYPTMLELKAQIDEQERQITSEIESIKTAFRAEYDAALAQEATLTEMLEGMKVEVLDIQNRSIDYTILKREVDTNRQLYDGLLQRYKEVGVAAGVSNNNLSVVDRAEGASRIRPNPRRNMLIGLLFGVVLGVLVALGIEYLDDTVKGPEDVEIKLKLVHLGVVPKLEKGETPTSAMLDPRSGFAEAYRSIRTALQFSTESGIPVVLAVTSTSPGEGKTTSAMALARNFAQLGKRVLLIDADLRNPSVHKLLGLDNGRGLSNYLSGALKPGECIQQLEDSTLSVLPCGPLPPNPAELLAGPRMLSLLTQAAERFDQIVIDAPPVVGLADAPILTNLAHGTLVVIEAGRARVGAVKASVKRLHAARARILGAVLTKFDSRSATYGYGNYSYMSYDYYAYGGKENRKLLGRR